MKIDSMKGVQFKNLRFVINKPLYALHIESTSLRNSKLTHCSPDNNDTYSDRADDITI
jgi:CMP-N-acetylneuraminic acid synthetase